MASAYLNFKKKFIQITGRFDLVTDLSNYATATIYGIDDVIWAGQKRLESLVSERKREFSWYKQDVAAGNIKLNVPNARVIKEVWYGDSEGKDPLDKKSLGWLRQTYGELSELTNATPKFWAIAVNRLSQDQADLTSANYTNEFSYDADDLYLPASVDETWAYDTVLFYPPLDQTYTISVLGKFWEKKLTGNDDINFWLAQYEDTLIEAGRMILERNNRNGNGAAEHLANIQLDLKGLMDDYVDEEIAGVNQQAG